MMQANRRLGRALLATASCIGAAQAATAAGSGGAAYGGAASLAQSRIVGSGTVRNRQP